jgi:hypothetical protein
VFAPSSGVSSSPPKTYLLRRFGRSSSQYYSTTALLWNVVGYGLCSQSHNKVPIFATNYLEKLLNYVLISELARCDSFHSYDSDHRCHQSHLEQICATCPASPLVVRAIPAYCQCGDQSHHVWKLLSGHHLQFKTSDVAQYGKKRNAKKNKNKNKNSLLLSPQQF